MCENLKKSLYFEIDSATGFNSQFIIEHIATHCLTDAKIKNRDERIKKLKMIIQNSKVFFEYIGGVVVLFYSFQPVICLTNYLGWYEITYASSWDIKHLIC